MKKTRLFLPVCGWALLGVGSAQASLFGRDAMLEPYIIGSAPVSIIQTAHVDSIIPRTPGVFADILNGMPFFDGKLKASSMQGLTPPSISAQVWVGGRRYETSLDKGGHFHDGFGYFNVYAQDALAPPTFNSANAGYVWGDQKFSQAYPYAIATDQREGPAYVSPTLSLTTFAVPLPGVAWLMMSVVMGLLGFFRAKRKTDLPA